MVPTQNEAGETVLEARAQKLEEIVETQFHAPDGLIHSFLDARTRRPFTAADVANHPRRFEGGPPPHDYLSHENTPMAMGAWLSALVSKERAKPTPLGASKISRAFSGIRLLADLSTPEFEKGWLCKPYGGRGSLESSNDQYGEVIAGLRELALFKEHPDAPLAATLLVELADFWIRHDYECPFHGNRRHRWMGRSQWGLVCMAFVRAAWEITGDRRYREEAERLCAVEKCDRPESRKGNFLALPFPERPHFGVRDLSAYHHLAVRFLDVLMDAWPERSADWAALLEMFWEDDVRPGLDEDGLLYANYEIDKNTNAWRPLESGFLPHSRRWVGPFKSGALSCFTAVSAVLTGCRIPARQPECRALAARILRGVDDCGMTLILDPSGSLDEPGKHPLKGRMLDGRAPAQWLLAYWRGRANGWWGGESNLS